MPALPRPGECLFPGVEWLRKEGLSCLPKAGAHALQSQRGALWFLPLAVGLLLLRPWLGSFSIGIADFCAALSAMRLKPD